MESVHSEFPIVFKSGSVIEWLSYTWYFPLLYCTDGTYDVHRYLFKGFSAAPVQQIMLRCWGFQTCTFARKRLLTTFWHRSNREYSICRLPVGFFWQIMFLFNLYQFSVWFHHGTLKKSRTSFQILQGARPCSSGAVPNSPGYSFCTKKCLEGGTGLQTYSQSQRFSPLAGTP